MAEDIFGRANSGFNGAFNSARAQMSISGIAGLDTLLITTIQAQYSQPVSRVYEVSSDKAYYVIGRPDGQGSIGAVFGPKNVGAVVYKDLADPCKKTDVVFSAPSATCPGTGTSSSFTRSLTGVVLQSLGFQVNAQDMLINENMGIMFATMTQS